MRDQIANICWIIKKAKEFQKNIYFCFIDYAKAFNYVDHNKLENSSRDGNTRPPDLALEKPIYRSGSNTLRGLEGVPGLPGAPQDEACLTRKFETSHVGGATCRTPPVPRSALEKDPRPVPLFEGNPVGEGTTRRGTATPVHRPQRLRYPHTARRGA